MRRCFLVIPLDRSFPGLRVVVPVHLGYRRSETCLRSKISKGVRSVIGFFCYRHGGASSWIYIGVE